ncbi:biotin--[acetyl-CoA-carboxylase] ligase [Arthrobacter sp. HY1533]|uniref:biotin--[acetyl-CoA-carboxylase] ligase n=1 Tax=Arthrobacter sp. HY1533 TaxID=2970919 RepID=UPI0022B9F34F|nr:biotin--[acetyl-CoA-carboxylase] ligase [Arthrobacter sp. HY1533]
MNGVPPSVNRPGLEAAALKAALLRPLGGFARVEVVESTGSTNTDLAAHAASPDAHWPDLSVLVANAQEDGKGRLGRSWVVPAGAAMISSVFLWPGERSAATGSAAPFAATGYAWLSILAGVALCRAVRTVAGVPAELKWPNDVVANGRKLAGILAQVVPAPTGNAPAASAGFTTTQAGPGVVVGAGLNVSLAEGELPTERATSLLLEGAVGDGLDRNALLPAYLNGFAALYRDFVAAGGDARVPLAGGASLLDLAGGLMGTLGREVRAELPGGTMLLGTATGLAADGGLLLRDAQGTMHTVSAGDVVHLRRTGPDGAVGYA